LPFYTAASSSEHSTTTDPRPEATWDGMEQASTTRISVGGVGSDKHDTSPHTKLRVFWKRCRRYKTLKLMQILLAIYVGFLTYADIDLPGGLRDQETGLIIDQASEERTEQGVMLVNRTERAIVATNSFQVICIGITRMSAFFMYPGKAFVFTSLDVCFIDSSAKNHFAMV
jgi:hypothetical protein